MTRTYQENHELNQTLLQKQDNKIIGHTRAHQLESRSAETLSYLGRVKFLGDRRWWIVRAFNEQYAILTRTGDFGRQDVYTIISWEQSRRGPHGSWGYGARTQEECEHALTAITDDTIHLSERASIYLDIKEIRNA